MSAFATMVVALDMIVLAGMLCYVVSAKNKATLHWVFFFFIIELLVWNASVLVAARFIDDPALFVLADNFSYLGAAFSPVTLLMLGIAYQKNFQGFSKRYTIFFIIPVATMILIFTNDYHHWFYLSYTTSGGYELGPFFYVHAIYSYACLFVGMVVLYTASVKASSALSSQAILILVGCILPVVTNLGYTLHLPGFHVYTTPLAFSLMVLLYLIAIFRFGFLKVVPIATQTAINRISDCFAVVDRDLNILDCNTSFERNFLEARPAQRASKLGDVLASMDVSDAHKRALTWSVSNAFESQQGQTCDFTLAGEHPRYYSAEFTPIIEGTRFPALVILVKDVTQHVCDMQALKENQGVLLEQERLASLGQMIGGIAHNLKSPILAISGSIDQTLCLVSEYRDSADDADVTPADHREIANEMEEWLAKTKVQLAYMSDIITTVKGQVTKMSERGNQPFTIGEALKRIQLLMQHPLVKAECTLDTKLFVSREQVIAGDVNSLVQVLDNIIDNAIQSYAGQGGVIELSVDRVDDDIRFAVKDCGSGIAPEISSVLFKEMTTTKGKNGTGLGLYISYSTIKGMFQGNMWFDTEMGSGTTFYVQIPIKGRAGEGV